MRCSKAIVASCVLVAAVAACGHTSPRVPPPAARGPTAAPSATLGPDEVAALVELLMAEDRRTLETGAVAKLLAHPITEVRARAALAAGRIGDPRVIELLVRALDDTAVVVGANAAFALGQLRDTSSTIVYALVRKLAGAWTETDPRAVEAVATFGRLGTPAAQAALRQVLQRYISDAAARTNGRGTEDAEPVGEVGKEALLTSWKFPRAETAIDLIVPHLDSPDEEVRWRAAFALMRIASPRTVPQLRDRLTDSNPLVRAQAARGLRASVVDSALQRPQTTVALIAALADPHPHVQINAAGAIATYADSTLAPALGVVLRSSDANVRLAGTQALAGLGGQAAADTLARIARESLERLVVRGAALSGLIRIEPVRGIGVAEAWLASTDWLVRLYATRALSSAPWGQVARLLPRLAEDRDARVAAAALRAVTSLTDSLTAPHGLYVQLLASHDVGVRAAAAAGLSRRASAADLSALLDAYDRAQRDTTGAAALAAIDGLAALQRNGVPVGRAFFLRFKRSPNREVRTRVARHIGTEGWGADTLETSRDRAFYERIVEDLIVPAAVDGRQPQVAIGTASGTIVIELAAADAPLTVHNFLSLASNGFFPGANATSSRFRWHRVVPNFVLQDGDPRGDGSGGPGHAIRDEISRLRFGRGMVGMARAGPNTGGSQFFITHSPQPHLDGEYTIFGRIVAGMDAADRVVQDDPIHSVEIRR